MNELTNGVLYLLTSHRHRPRSIRAELPLCYSTVIRVRRLNVIAYLGHACNAKRVVCIDILFTLGPTDWRFLKSLDCAQRRCALVLEHLECDQFQAYMSKRVNCDVSNCVYNIISKLRSNPCNLAFSSVFGTGFRCLFETRPNTIPTRCIRMYQNILDVEKLLVSESNLNSIAVNSTPMAAETP